MSKSLLSIDIGIKNLGWSYILYDPKKNETNLSISFDIYTIDEEHKKGKESTVVYRCRRINEFFEQFEEGEIEDIVIERQEDVMKRQEFNRSKSNQQEHLEYIDRKIRTCISKVQLNDKTYHQEGFCPTLVNFFYGSNGSGKSTIARKISAREGLVWETYDNTNLMCMIGDCFCISF